MSYKIKQLVTGQMVRHTNNKYSEVEGEDDRSDV